MPQFSHEEALFNRVRPQYRKIAQMVQAIIASYVDANGRITDVSGLERAVKRYADSLLPWAEAFWTKQNAYIARQIARDFRMNGLTVDPQSASIRSTVAHLQRQQVQLITTLPLSAAKKAQEMSQQAVLETGQRSEELIAQLRGLKPGYPEYAARRLARTESAKAQSAIVQGQANELGIKQYVWCTVRDEAVRSSHDAMQGKICDFDNPPEVEPGKRYHPGGIYNCRCFCRPLLPKE